MELVASHLRSLAWRSRSRRFAYGGPLSAFRIVGAGATMDVSYYK
jgi:hypothetical protein